MNPLTNSDERGPHVDRQQVHVVVAQQVAAAGGRGQQRDRHVRDRGEEQCRQRAQGDAAAGALQLTWERSKTENVFIID